MIQPYQRQFDFGMSAVAMFLILACTENRANMLSETTHNIQKLALACRLIISHSRFYQMPRVIHFMIIFEIRPALLWLKEHEIAVEIAIRLLGFCNQPDNGIEFIF